MMISPDLVDCDRLERDPAYRFAYLCGYVGLTAQDRALIRLSRPLLEPWKPELIAAIEERLLGWSNTRRHFASEDQVTVHVQAYIEHLFRLRDESELASYLDHVGAAHGPGHRGAGRAIPLVETHALLAFIADKVVEQILVLDLDPSRKAAAVRAWSKFFWIQADAFHHAATPSNPR